MANNDIKETIQESMLKVIEMIMAENNGCEDVNSLSKAIVSKLSLQLEQDLHKN